MACLGATRMLLRTRAAASASAIITSAARPSTIPPSLGRWLSPSTATAARRTAHPHPRNISAVKSRSSTGAAAAAARASGGPGGESGGGARRSANSRNILSSAAKSRSSTSAAAGSSDAPSTAEVSGAAGAGGAVDCVRITALSGGDVGALSDVLLSLGCTCCSVEVGLYLPPLCLLLLCCPL